MSSNAEICLTAYIQRYGNIPDQPNSLVTFSRTETEIPTIIYSEAKKAISKIKKSIKSKGKKSKNGATKNNKYQVGDEVLISKDRTGYLHYIGPVPEMGDDKIYYGLELTSGTLGQHNGQIKGKRYFHCDGKRGMFVPEHKLRRKLNSKDKSRRNSYVEVSNQVKNLQKQYVGDNPSFVYPDYSSTSPPQNAMTAQNLQKLIFENGDLNGNKEESPSQNAEENDENVNVNMNKLNLKIKKRRSKSHKKNQIKRKSSHHSKKSNSTAEDEESEDESTEDTESEVSELNEKNGNDSHSHAPTVKTFDTLLKYIMRQKGQYREGLLDVYANPQTHVLVVEAFSQMKQLQPAEQAFLWPALLKRWSKYAAS